MDFFASESIWILFALAYSVFMPIYALVAEVFPGRVLRLMFLTRVFTFIAVLPIIFFLSPPTDPVFYLAVIGCSVLFAYADLVFFGLIAKNGAAVVARIEPLSSWALFFVWAAFSPVLLFEYLDNPLQLGGLALSISLCAFFALRLRKCDVSWSVLKRILPMLCVTVAATFLSKVAMNHSPLHSGIWYYTAVQCVTMMSVHLILFRLPKIPTLGDLDIPKADVPGRLFTKRAAFFGLLCAFGLLSTQSTKYYAISLSENPAYVTAFGLLAPFWIMLVYRLKGRREEVDVVSGLGIVFSTVLLVYFTQF